ncbi:VPLPA-CTERM sorting domain-containing protein [Jannaschia sp. CCS1]|uniref:VPLPA-CTERM sorting domain-containing protein n=1 Tax=Jannaschia sp. (strain CCS1) TaxID=290400 RepID=UPI000053A80D|nr:VPLPA-CTERM sorting domain-containing protein [Jannaschia sp. CCS1]ABD53722.1 hypothetical protein Jann_0805 [Jannaschia sp. CCS1]
MTFKTLIGAVALALAAGTVNAATITFNTFNIGEFNTAVNGGTVEDFEGFAGGTGWNSSTVTSVGTFAANTGTGSGSVCNTQSGGNCTDLFINDTTLSGQGNLVPAGAGNALSSNDTNGIFWDVFLAGNAMFNRIVFAVNDAADLNNTIFTVLTDDGSSATLSGQANGNEQLVVIDLGGMVSSATVSMFNNRTNDGFTIDGAAATVAPVPLPAGAVLLLGGLGALAVMRRRRAAAA